MGFNVNFDSLDAMYTSIYSQSGKWLSALETLSNATTALAESSEMAGTGADAIRSYMSSVHGMMQGLIAQLIQLHEKNNLLYKNDYQQNIDTSLHAVIKQSELDSLHQSLSRQNSQAIEVDGELRYAMGRIQDIFTLYYNDITNVDQTHTAAMNFLTGLDDAIQDLESRHTGSDFTNTGDMITHLTAMIQELLTKDRNYKSDFSMEALAGSEKFRNLYDSYVKVSKECEDKASAIETALENENQRIADLQAEYEQRQKEAQVITWIVTGACIVASIAISAAAIAAVAATGGVAIPLVVGAVSAGSSALISATNNLANSYVEHGNLENVDWGSFGKDVVFGAATGFVTGFVGAGLGGAITSGLSKTAAGTALLNSSNLVTRIGSHAVIGSVAEVSSGIVSRAAGTFITTLDVEESLSNAFDGKNIVQDAILGGTSNALDEVVHLKQAQSAADNAAAKYNNKYNPLEAGQENGLTNLKPTRNGGVDFSDSDYILRTEAGEAIEIKIQSTGSRAKDYKLAEKMLKERGIDIDFKSMRTGDNATHVWHHVDDYDVLTNETTMQFITRDAHAGIENHMGSATQYHIANGTGYGKQAFDPKYGFNYLDYTSPAINAAGDAVNNLNALDQNITNQIDAMYQSIKDSSSWNNTDPMSMPT